MRGMELARIHLEIADDLGSWRVEIPGTLVGEATALSGPTTAEGARVQLHNAPGAEVGPGQIATWGGTTDRGRLRLPLGAQRQVQQALPVLLARTRRRLTGARATLPSASSRRWFRPNRGS
jgi:hypothetical protein